MGIYNEKLWECLTKITKSEDCGKPFDQQISHDYLCGIKEICDYGINRAKTIRDTFPMFTLHDETHICNVMRLMVELLGDSIEMLSRDETAMLILSACCHDIGMSYSEEDKEELFEDIDRLNKYLDIHHSEYVKAYSNGSGKPIMTPEMIQTYLRSIHHERVSELLDKIEWPSILNGRVDKEDLINVCQSHGMDTYSLNSFEQTPSIDLRFCAILLRIADILDFDTSRAPQAVYDYCGFNKLNAPENVISREEWRKHMASHGFDFKNITNRSYPYELNYTANSNSMRIEQTINCYLDWVDNELISCDKQIHRFTGKWQSFVLPGKVKRNIKCDGYVSGQYRLTLDQSKIMELLVGRNLYNDPSVFVRELIQNAIDAVRTRKQLDKTLPDDWKPQIKIRCWMDDEGYHWFRIEDNGIGMTEEIIMNYLLKVGCSYYTSDTFRQEKLRCRADPDYTPISRFGIGILSCFIGGERTNQVEISTKRFNEDRTYNPGLRLSMHGMDGYYYMASSAQNHHPGPMKGVTEEEKKEYLRQAGTIIAVRTNLYQTGKYNGFKEIIDRYVIYPPVAIHYDGMEGSFDYLTEADLMDVVHNIKSNNDWEKEGLLEFSLSKEQLDKIKHDRPEIVLTNPPKVLLKCTSLDHCTESPYLSGVVLSSKIEGEIAPFFIKLGNEKVEVKVKLVIHIKQNTINMIIMLDLPSSFESRIHFIDKIFYEIENSDHFYQLEDHYKGDSLRSEILRLNFSRHIKERKPYLAKKYNLSIEELNNIIKEMKEKIYDCENLSISAKDIEIYEDYRNCKLEWTFPVFDLSKLDWYKKFFQDIINKTGQYSITAHNGILCGTADFFLENKERNLGAILLLKDKYCPILDISRDRIRELTLETACDLEITRNRLIDSGFKLFTENQALDETLFPYFSIKKYWDLLEERPDFAKQMRICTKNGKYTREELYQIILKNGKQLLFNPPQLIDKFKYGSGNTCYEYLYMSYLRKEFTLLLHFDYHTKIYIDIKNSSLDTDNEQIFPPGFFIHPLDSSCPYLTSKSTYFRYAYNSEHRFSKFIIQNGNLLFEYVPGIFNEILRSLAEDECDILIDNTARLLNHLQNLPNGVIEVPNDIYLTQEDFYSW